ncbi:MAG: carboxypeptidase-like regulatory domain-containing protein [Pedobacter sp.]|nr:MAG: carboxypeptidase-like regulatory domain-containing protein [Pedobacter sp.]
MIKSAFLFLLFWVFTMSAFSQGTFSISGKVRDNGGVLPGAGVYLSGYKIATVVDNNGNFSLPNLKPGSYDLLVQMVGYLPFSKSVIISE